ncbi:MAG: tetratricopeptide repeat protein [Ignavibacteria bacterium]|nr:tetratricopeptide repeat protein [Ignavibacteria bacterium]
MQYRYIFAHYFSCRINRQPSRNLVVGRLLVLIALFSLFACASEVPSSLFAQERSPLPRIKSPIADSLEKLLTTNLSDSARVDILVELARALWANKLEDSRRIAFEALTLAERLGYQKGIANSFNTIGVTYYYQGWYDIALGYHQKSLAIRKSLNDTAGIGHSTNNIGLIYMGQRKHEESLTYLLEALHIYKTLNRTPSIAAAYNNIGTIYRRQKRLDSAAKMHEEAIKTLEGKNNRAGMALSYNSLGGVLEDAGSFSEALRLQEQALKLYEEIPNHKGIVNSLYASASVLAKMKRFPEALTNLRRAIDIATAMDSRPELRDCLELLSQIEESIGNIQGALFNFKRFEALKDSLISEEAAARSAEFNAKYDTERKAKQIELLTAQRQRQSVERNLLLALVTASLMAVGLFYTRYRIKRKSETALQNANAQLQEKNDLLSQARSIAETLLLNVLPKPIARRMQAGELRIAEHFSDVTVLFADIVDFTQLASDLHPEELVSLLDAIFTDFDALAERYNLEKIKTIGDAYMAVCGIPEPNPQHCLNVVRFGLDMLRVIEKYSIHGAPQLPTSDNHLRLRIGIHTGAVVAGVIGKKKFSYDLWGDTVNIASRLESHGVAGEIHCSQEVYEMLQESCIFEMRGETELKGSITMTTYFLRGFKPL